VSGQGTSEIAPESDPCWLAVGNPLHCPAGAVEWMLPLELACNALTLFGSDADIDTALPITCFTAPHSRSTAFLREPFPAIMKRSQL